MDLAQVFALAARGWPVFPVYEVVNGACACGSLTCGQNSGKHPRNANGVSGATRDRDRIRAWHARWPTTSWGIACGLEARLLVVDLDLKPGVDGAESLAALGELPVGPTVETGSGGRHHYLRFPEGLDAQNSGGKLGLGIDVRWTGGYVIAPGSTHTSGRPYRWLEGEELDPPQAPPWLVSLLASSAADRGTDRIVRRRKESPPAIIAHGRHQWLLDTTAKMVGWGMSDEAIEAALQAEIPKRLDLSDGRTITVREVRDAVRGARQKGFDDVDHAALAVAGAPIAAALAAEAERKVASEPPETIVGPGASLSRLEPVQQGVPVNGKHPRSVLTALLDRTTGPLRELADYCLADAPRPQPEMALAAALTTWAGVLGGRVELADATRTNLYIIAVAESGAGKDAPRNACKRSLQAAELYDLVGADAWASHAGIHTQLMVNAQRVSFVDEFGKLIELVAAERAPTHLKEILTILIKLYTSSAELYLGAAYADGKKNVSIRCPHLCVYGTTTYRTLFGSLTREACGDGLLARTLIFRVTDDLPEKRLDVVRTAPPPGLIAALRAWSAFGQGDIGTKAHRVPVTAEGRRILDAYSEECDRWVRQHPGSPVRSLYTRGHASAKKVALVHACATALPTTHEEGPIVDAASAEWGVEFVRHCTDYSARECVRSVGESKHEKLLIDLEQHVRASPGLSITELARGWRRVPDRQRKELLSELIEQGRLRVGEREPDGGKGRPATVLYAI